MKWNNCGVIIVLIALQEIALGLRASSQDGAAASGSDSNVSILRILWVLKTMRLLRTLHNPLVIRHLSRLRTLMVSTIISKMRELLLALVQLLLIMYVYGILFSASVAAKASAARCSRPSLKY